MIGRLSIIHNWISTKQPIIDSAEHNLLDFYRVALAAIFKCLIFNFLWHALAVLEVLLILQFVETNLAVVSAFVSTSPLSNRKIPSRERRKNHLGL